MENYRCPAGGPRLFSARRYAILFAAGDKELTQ
jgi:hypothetical protein